MVLTSATSTTWEQRLLRHAQEAFQDSASIPLPGSTSTLRLDQAYEHCRCLTAAHSRSFYLASLFLPAEKRRAMQALYAFCRTADDIVDHPGGNPQADLEAWQRTALSSNPKRDDLVAVAWTDARRRYHIPVRLAEQLLEGVARDLQPVRYETFEQLAEYAYGVASTVGLMSMHITGFHSKEAVPYAVKLGVALQLTNILRDVGEDLRRGRVYLPQDELDFFGVPRADLEAGSISDGWRAFMRFQIRRNRQLYTEAWPGIGLLEQDGRLAIAAAARFYAAILDDIEAHEYNIFSRRAHLSGWQKLIRLPGIWWDSQNPFQAEILAVEVSGMERMA